MNHAKIDPSISRVEVTPKCPECKEPMQGGIEDDYTREFLCKHGKRTYMVLEDKP